MATHVPSHRGSSEPRRTRASTRSESSVRSPRVLFLGGNGHASVRLEGVRGHWRRPLPKVVEAAYPGFEGRPPAASFDEFLLAIARQADGRYDAVYATGIGAMFALALRADGKLRNDRLILQAPVLWGLERRMFPRVMRTIPGATELLRRLFRTRAFQRHFLAKYFATAPDEETARRFFNGYAECPAFGSLFHWVTPALLRRIETRFADDPAALHDIGIWWGEQDAVVGLEELRITEKALNVHWPVRVFPEWGHYPMIEDPRGWLETLGNALA